MMATASTTLLERTPLKQGMVDMAVILNPTHLMTMRFNNLKQQTLVVGEDKMKFFFGQLERFLLGPRWYQMNALQRSHYLAIPEGRPGGRRNAWDNLHYHALVRLAPFPMLNVSLLELIDKSEKLWHKCVPAGDIDVRPVYDSCGAGDYAGKHCEGNSSLGMQGYMIN